MKDTLLKIAGFIDEQNCRLQALEQQAEAAEKANKELAEEIAFLKKRIEELENRPTANAEEEPEVEVELILSEENEEEENLSSEPETEIVEVSTDEPTEETPTADSITEPVSEVVPETKTTPVAEEEKKNQAPLQTNLFGAAVTDIRHAISLGDRFLFQRELFGGNGEAMQKALNDLNTCSNLDEAIAYVNKLGWNRESSTYDLFINVLRRRFDH